MNALLRVTGPFAVALGASCAAPAPARLYVAETSGRISVFDLDRSDGSLRALGHASAPGPMRFLTFHPSLDRLYAISGKRLQVFELDSRTGLPALLGSADTGVRGTHLALDRTGRWVFVASYGDHAVAMLPLAADGMPGAPALTLGGRDDLTYRNAHQARVHPENRFVYVPCLGADHVAVLALDADRGTLELAWTAPVADGAGPRHMDFHPALDVAYVLNERASTVNVFALDRSTGALRPLQVLSGLPEGVAVPSRSSDIHVTPDGRFVYAMHREPCNEVVRLAVDEQGRVSRAGAVATGGDHARTFTIDESGRWLVAGNSRSKSITTFRVEPDGTLRPAHAPVVLDDPVWFVGMR